MKLYDKTHGESDARLIAQILKAVHDGTAEHEDIHTLIRLLYRPWADPDYDRDHAWLATLEAAPAPPEPVTPESAGTIRDGSVIWIDQ